MAVAARQYWPAIEHLGFRVVLDPLHAMRAFARSLALLGERQAGQRRRGAVRD
jgi:hypothetical protein